MRLFAFAGLLGLACVVSGDATVAEESIEAMYEPMMGDLRFEMAGAPGDES